MSHAPVALSEPIRRAAELQSAEGGFASVDDYVTSLIEADAATPVAAKLEAALIVGLDGNGVDAATIGLPQKRQALSARCDGPRRPGLRA